MSPQRTWLAVGLAGVAMCVLVGTVFDGGDGGSNSAGTKVVTGSGDGSDDTTGDTTATGDTSATDVGASETTIPAEATTTTQFVPFKTTKGVLSDPDGFQKPYQNAKVDGMLTFRGNTTRSFHGTGPIPRTTPQILWKAPGNRMCGSSSEYHNVRTWCGTGWTGQAAVFERDAKTWVVFGAYDYKIHFLDADTGKDIIPAFKTGDLAKGNVTIDPDGYPLVYQGSRDNYFRVIAFDGTEPRELYKIDAQTDDRHWNNDWDAAPLVLGDYLIEGSENSWFYGWKLNRGYAADGSVTANPKLVFRVPGWDQELLDALGDDRVSLESSVMVLNNTAYLNSSGGLLQGWDLSGLTSGVKPKRVFRFWTGDDSDATVVGDPDGFLYVGVEGDRLTSKLKEQGNLLKIDPKNKANPVVWSVKTWGKDNGTWSTPAIYNDLVVWPTKPGTIYGLDRATGEVRWKIKTSGPALSSASIVDGILLFGDGGGHLRAWDLGDGKAQPALLWELNLPANIESSLSIWKGKIYVGTRDGYMYCIGLP